MPGPTPRSSRKPLPEAFWGGVSAGGKRQTAPKETDVVWSFLIAACFESTGVWTLFLMLSRTGMRIGEALALQWPEINFDDHSIPIVRALSAGQLDTPKTGHGRSIDISHQPGCA